VAPIPPCFSQKRLQAAENKGNRCEKERQEKPRGSKLLKTCEIQERRNTEGAEIGAERIAEGYPLTPGVSEKESGFA